MAMTKEPTERVKLLKVILFLGSVSAVCTSTGGYMVGKLAASANSHILGVVGLLLAVGGGFFLCLSLKFLNGLGEEDTKEKENAKT